MSKNTLRDEHDGNCRAFANLAGIRAHDVPVSTEAMMHDWMLEDIKHGEEVPPPNT